MADTEVGVMVSGRALEDLSDAIDHVNVLHATMDNNANDDNKRAEGEAAKYNEASVFDLRKDKAQFRQYDAACDRVRSFYREQHEKQTVDFNVAARVRFHSAARRRPEMTVWQAMEKLNTLIDDSDPDTELSQIQHLLQSAEAIRRDGKPRWMQLTGLIHDLGKLLFFEQDAGAGVLQTAGGAAPGQWAVVGDTFPVGCAFDRDAIIYPETLAGNPDDAHSVYSTKHGIYEPGCGLDNVMLSWGHDEYLYHVVKDQSRLPPESLAMIRYHSFYPWHARGAYRHLMCDKDYAMLDAVKAFNPYDLYSKSDDVPSVEVLKPYYLELIDEFFPQKVIKW